MKKILYIIIVCVCCLQTRAQQPRMKQETSRAFMLGIGRTAQLDTYLSPMDYKGPGMTFMEEYQRDIDKNKHRVTFRSTIEASFSPGHAWEGGIDAMGGDIRYDATWQYHFRTPGIQHLMLKAGGGFNATLGGMYISHGGNNPAQAHAQLQLLGAISVEYTIPTRRPCLLHYNADLPLVGGMFSPAYGQSYYEIFERGNYDHNIVLTLPFSDFSLRQQLWFDINLNRKTRETAPYLYLRIGYMNEIRQLQPNHLKQKNLSNALMVGVVKHF